MAMGGGAGQMSYTRGVYELYWANRRQEVLIMGGYIGDHDDATNEVFKMIIEQDGTIRFEASTPMRREGGLQTCVYHQGEIYSIFTAEIQRLDKLLIMQMAHQNSMRQWLSPSRMF